MCKGTLMMKTYVITVSLDEGVSYVLKFEASGVKDLFQQFFPKADSEKYYDITQNLIVDTGSYYNRTPITVEKVAEAIYNSHVDGDSEYRFQIFEFESDNARGKEVTYTLDEYFPITRP